MKTLNFNAITNRWQIDERELHCGDCFKLHADTESLPPINVRIEHGSREGWYLITPYGITKPSVRKAE